MRVLLVIEVFLWDFLCNYYKNSQKYSFGRCVQMIGFIEMTPTGLEPVT
jgi:hypothetical protein